LEKKVEKGTRKVPEKKNITKGNHATHVATGKPEIKEKGEQQGSLLN